MKLTKKKIFAIEQVLTINKDMVELCEKRGVTWEDLKEGFRLAYQAAPTTKKDEEEGWV